MYEDVSSKRGCSTTNKLIQCPLYELGCKVELSYDDLVKHYSSEIHQRTLLKAIEIFVRELHKKSNNIQSQLNLEKEDYSELLEVVKTLAEGVSCLHDENVTLHTNFVQLLSHIMEQGKEIEQLKKRENEISQMYHAIQVNNSMLQTEMETMKQTLLDSSSLTSSDGSYIWKITNVSDKIANAIADRQTSIYSPPFYSSSTGYKMCMRLYLNGDGQARRTHMSLFFVLMRNDYDAILVWPFQYKITFCSYDQTGNQRHIFDSFRPDIKSNSFQRPTSNMNIASGIPKFLPLSIIQQENNPYIRDDCMFIRCILDFSSLPKACIPIIANINPGLPSAVQQNMIQREIQKHRNVTSTESGQMESSEKMNNLEAK